MPTMPAVLGPNTRLNNFRLGYLPADVVADRPTHIRVIIGGIDVTRPDAPTRVLYKSMTIQDRVYDEPNTCALTLYGAAPTVGASIEVWVNSNAPVLLFNGELQTVEQTYKGRPSTVVHPVTAIDDTARANRRRPLMPFVNVSATTIAQTLMATFAPGFSSAGVEANLPPVTITFDGSEGGMKGCLTALAKLIGAYWYFELRTLYFFVTPPGGAPDPIDDTPGRFLHEPAITWAYDKSQVRTRVYGKGASTQIATTIAANTDLVPVREATMFNPAGGKAIAGLSPEAAASRILTYTGVQLGGGGGLVGPGAAPSAPPALAPLDGAGMEAGAHSYGYTFTTASGESLVSPTAAITVGPLAAPATALVAGAPTAGGAVPPGTYRYTVTFVTAIGETTGAPPSPPVTTTAVAAITPPAAPALAGANGYFPNLPGGTYYYAYGYQTALGSTVPGPATAAIPIPAGNPAGLAPYQYTSTFRSTDPRVTHINIYRTPVNQPASALRLLAQFSNTTTEQLFVDANQFALGAAAPTVDTSAGPSLQTVPLSQVPTGPPNVTARRIYREGVGWWYLVGTIANNTATTFTDTAASTGAGMPGANTAIAAQVRVTLPLGASAVTGRKIYRTASGLSALRLLATLGDNTTTTYTDAALDSGLGAAPPVTDTSSLTQPNGQVPAGVTAIIVANPAAFSSSGGWAVVGNGEQVIRYTGKSANALTGIPATGPGALVASVSYNSTITVAPALVGVTGVLEQILRSAPIHVWVQRDDLAAQSAMAALDGSGDGVYEHIWSDERRSEPSLIQVCDAQLKLYSRPLVTVTYATRDLKTKSGKTVLIVLSSPAIQASLPIQDVTISELGIKGLLPKFTVTASNARQSFEAILQMLIRKADA
jgi:hypothetical protein